MKKLIISGSSHLYERALYWRGYFEGRGYEVIDWPTPITDDPDAASDTPIPGFLKGRRLNSADELYADRVIKTYERYWKNLELADVFFLMNEDRDDIEGYIGPSAFSELTAAVIGNLNHDRKTEIYLLKLPAKTERCYEEVKFWYQQGWVELYQRPTGKKAFLPLTEDVQLPAISAPSRTVESAETTITTNTTAALTTTDVAADNATDTASSADTTASAATDTTATAPLSSPKHPGPFTAAAPLLSPKRPGLFTTTDKTIDVRTSNKRCLRSLTPMVREYLALLTPDFPAWLLRYIAAPEMQRLAHVSMTSMDYSSLYNFQNFNSVLAHSIGVALIIWNFTHDQKQTLAGLFHDIASPSFKHCIDFMNGDSERQESTEARTAEIIRDSHHIMRQLKKDGILASEVSDYHLYPIADNELPHLAADRLEYTFSNGYLLYDTWNLTTIEKFYRDLTILENEAGLPELGFRTPAIAAEFTEFNLTLAAHYSNDKARITLQFIADIISSMIASGYLAVDDLYVMSEREIIDWILSCGDHTISDAFRNFQRATAVTASTTAKKNLYTTNVRTKIRYIVPLAATDSDDSTAGSGSAGSTSANSASSGSTSYTPSTAARITDLDRHTNRAVAKYLAQKPTKYISFDFDFKPYTAK